MSGPQLSGRVTALALPDFGVPGVEHSAYIRFHSDRSTSDEDGWYDSAVDAGLVVDNLVVSGGTLSYSEDFEGSTLNPNVTLLNSDRSKSFGSWARLYSHVTDNDKCVENTTCAWLFSDPVRTAFFPDMAWGPGGAVVRNWLDDTITSPWITLTQDPSLSRLVLSFREFGGNRWASGRIARAVAIRGMYGNGTCETKWMGEEEKYDHTWWVLDSFNWVTNVYELSGFFSKDWEKVQVRFRVADWQGIYGAPPPGTLDTGPGPYIDRVRIGRMVGGPYIYVGPDTRFQAQDAFPTVQNAIGLGEHFSPSTDIFGSCAFSMAYDLGIPPSEFEQGSDNLITGDSIVVAVRDLGDAGIHRVGFYYRVVAGPHTGMKVDPRATLLSNGLCQSESLFVPAYQGWKWFGMDFNDFYFRGGDVLEYFWYAETDARDPVSYPPGIDTDPADPSFSLAQAELLTGGLMEVSFLPTITWDPAYVARVAADPDEVGDVDPTPEEIANSSQTNCILYVNKVNTARRTGSANRTSFMYTLDRLGYRGHYDVYDVQGFGNTNNDLGGRASTVQATSYSLIVHDVGRSGIATIPDGTDRTMLKIDQAQWYEDYLNNGLVSAAGSATLWVIGENWAFENAANNLVSTTMQIGSIVDNEGIDFPEVEGQTSFTFANGSVVPFAGKEFWLASGCPASRAYDGFGTGAVVTHRYGVRGTTASGPAAVVMNKNTTYKWNTIGMGFNWFDIEPAGTPTVNPQGLDEDEELAQKILNGVLPLGCIMTPTDASPGEETDVVPRVTALYQNVPNPCNPRTTIGFDLAQEEFVVLRLYDIAGHLVRTLVSDKRPRGLHAVVWDGTDNAGHPVASGVYLYRFDAGQYSATRKLLVLK